MPDNYLDILIRFGLDKSKAQEAAAELKKLGEETAKTGAAGVKANEEVAQATEKAFTKKKELKDMLKQLGHEFPLLSQIGRLALNPIALASAAIVASVQLWNTKLKELTRSLGGIEMPDVSEDAISRTNRLAAAWGEMATKMAEAANQSKGIKTSLDDVKATIDANAELFKALGIDTRTGAAEAKAGETLSAANALDASGRARIARAGKVGSAASEDSAQKAMSAAVEKAILEKAETEKRIGWLNDLSQSGWLGRMIASPKFVTRYGYPNGFSNLNSSADIASALDMERGNLAGQQAIIDRGAQFSAARASRAVRRNEIAGGQADIDAAAGMRGDAMGLFRQAAIGSAAAGRAGAGNLNLSGNLMSIAGELPQLLEAIIALSNVAPMVKRANEIAQDAKRRTQ